MKENQPLITIITVVYNGEAFLEQTIKSVIDINYKNLNYIIIDGGSKDESSNIIKKYGPNIYKWVSEPDKGIYDAMNKGWKIAKPESYILFLGAGDLIYSLPDFLIDDYSRVYYGNVLIGEKLFKSRYNFKLKLGNTMHHQALLIPKKIHQLPPFDIQYRLYADFDFNQRLLKQRVPFEYSKAFVSFALPGGLSSIKDDNEMLSIVNKNFGRVITLVAYFYYTFQGFKQKYVSSIVFSLFVNYSQLPI